MIYRIVGVSMFFFCLIAIGLSLSGITHVDIGAPFLAFMNQCSRDLEAIKIEIPDIPQIPRWTVPVEEGSDILTMLASIVNFFVFFGNMFVTTLNIIVTMINVIIQLLQFLFIILRNIIHFKDTLHQTPSPSIPIPAV